MVGKHLKMVAEEASVNLTPMIDIVFLLIIFFMLVTELTNLALEQVILPIAAHAKENPGKEGEVVVNIKQGENQASDPGAGVIVIAGQLIKGEGQGLNRGLVDTLRLEAETYGKWTPNDQHPSGKNSELEVLVRSDRQVRSEYFLALMWACNDIGIYKVHVAAQQFKLE